jgi:hypothetical protein
MGKKAFIGLDTIVEAILLKIGDEQRNRYRTKATQWALDTYRQVNVSYSSFYLTEYADINSMGVGQYPEGLVKLLSVGLYVHGIFQPFIKEPDLAMQATGENGAYDTTKGEGIPIPTKGYRYAAKANSIGYWQESPGDCTFTVRCHRFDFFDGVASNVQDVTCDIQDRAVIRYKTNGLDCERGIQIPSEARDMIVAKVVLDFMVMGIPSRFTAAQLQLQRDEVDRLYQNYIDLIYDPHNFWEAKDAIYNSLNTVPRR